MLAASWITAAATAVLAMFAIVTAIFAIRTFRKQAEEVRVQLQAGRRLAALPFPTRA